MMRTAAIQGRCWSTGKPSCRTARMAVRGRPASSALPLYNPDVCVCGADSNDCYTQKARLNTLKEVQEDRGGAAMACPPWRSVHATCVRGYLRPIFLPAGVKTTWEMVRRGKGGVTTRVRSSTHNTRNAPARRKTPKPFRWGRPALSGRTGNGLSLPLASAGMTARIPSWSGISWSTP